MYPKLLLGAFVSLIFDVEQILEQLSDLNYLLTKNVEEFMLYTSSLDAHVYVYWIMFTPKTM